MVPAFEGRRQSTYAPLDQRGAGTPKSCPCAYRAAERPAIGIASIEDFSGWTRTLRIGEAGTLRSPSPCPGAS